MKTLTKPATSTTSKIGFYVCNAGVFKVVKAKTGSHEYALKLNEDGKWDYAPGAIKNLRPETKMSLEYAAAYGRRTGRCMVCGRTLTKKDSIDAGIGPICAGGF